MFPTDFKPYCNKCLLMEPEVVGDIMYSVNDVVADFRIIKCVYAKYCEQVEKYYEEKIKENTNA